MDDLTAKMNGWCHCDGPQLSIYGFIAETPWYLRCQEPNLSCLTIGQLNMFIGLKYLDWYTTLTILCK